MFAAVRVNVNIVNTRDILFHGEIEVTRHVLTDDQTNEMNFSGKYGLIDLKVDRVFFAEVDDMLKFSGD